MRRDYCECYGGFWDVYSKGSDTSLIACYGGWTDIDALVVAQAIRESMNYAKIYFPREEKLPTVANKQIQVLSAGS